jgi:hypothetical protein
MSSAGLIGERWEKIVQWYQEIHPAHRQEAMKALITAVVEAGARNGVWPHTSHFTLFVSADDMTHWLEPLTRVSLSVQYWHEVDKFQIRYYNIQGVAYDEKWCELAEAQATLRHLFRQMRQADLDTQSLL